MTLPPDPPSDPAADPGEVTRLLHLARDGDREALDRLVPLVYEDLRRMAHRQLDREGGGHTLQTTGLLHEASSLKGLAWYQVMLGNLIAASAMGFYFWRTHRELGDEFRHSLDWDTELVPPEHRENIPSAKVGADRPTVSKG